MQSYRRIPSCSRTYCLHVKGRSVEYETSVILDIVRLRGSAKGSVREVKSGPGHKERCTSPATVDRPWHLTTWTTTCVPTHFDPEVQAERSTEALISRDKLHRSLDIQRQTTQKPWYPEIKYTEALTSRGKLHRSLDIQRQTTQKLCYPEIKLHRSLDIQR